ncbi:MAG: hypothetical protein ASARMPREDX12_002974 [Alectoria sarmentosa]|nr:MAG: hypothetical protein ASARMPREDX12_002974 [Alectoria sarmentosa]
MSERKVLQKYYPPDFDPSKIARSRVPKNAGPKVMTVRLMAPFSMKCMSCGEYIYKGRKFNSRKETTEEKYLNIPIYRFYIRCTRCSAEITFKTDPKGMDYTCERGAKRNFEVWRKTDGEDDKHNLETDEERLDRLEAEEAERGAMEVLEGKVLDAKREMEIADALDEIRTRNARIQRAEGKGEVDNALEQAERARAELEWEKKRVEAEDEEAARRAFGRGIEIDDPIIEEGAAGQVVNTTDMDGAGTLAEGGVSKVTATKGATVGTMPPPEFKRVVKKKKDFSAALGIKKKPALV